MNELSETTPVLVDLKPTGTGYMEDLHAAGGIPAVLRELRPLLHLDCVTVTGETIGERIDAAHPWVDREIIRPVDDPVRETGGLVALFGNLAPKGSILKRAAADPDLFEREGRAVVFTSLEDLAARIDDPDLDVTAGRFPRPSERRPGQRGGHAGGRLSADPVEARACRRQGHGADFGCAHERDGLWHDRPACDAGCGIRRAAGAGAQRRPHPAERGGAAAGAAGGGRRAGTPAGRAQARRAGSRAGLPASL